jgi:hypothetical protein
MQYIQGTVKRLVKGEGGHRRLLLERKDSTEFVVEVLPTTEVCGIGTLFRSNGFIKKEQHMGRDVYEQVEEYKEQTVINVDGEALEMLNIDKCSIELAAIINLSSQVLNQSPDKILGDIIKIYKEL